MEIQYVNYKFKICTYSIKYLKLYYLDIINYIIYFVIIIKKFNNIIYRTKIIIILNTIIIN